MRRVFLVLILFTVSSLRAQQSLTFEQALVQCMVSNPSVDAAKAAHAAATAQRKAAFGLRLPNLAASANYTIMSQDIGHFDLNPQKDKALEIIGSLGIPIPPQIGQAIKAMDLSYTLQRDNFAMVGLSLTVPIYTGGRINAANEAARIKESKAELATDVVSEELFVEVAERYWGLMLQKNVTDLLGEVVSGVRVHLENARQLEQNGIVAKGETLFAEMSYSQAVAAYENAQLEVKTINSALSGSLGQEAQYEPMTPLFISSEIGSLDSFQQKVRSNNNQLKQVGLIKKLAQQAVRAERGGFFPQVAAMGGWDVWNYQLSDQLPRWIAGVGVRINLFDGLIRENNYKAAKSQVKQVEAMELKANTDIMILVEKLYNSLLGAEQQVAASEKSIEFGREYLRIKEKAFAEGMATSSDVIDAQLNLSKYKTERLAALYAFDLSLAKLLALSGESDRIFQYIK